MKKLFTILLAAIALSSCETIFGDDTIWDVAPVDIYITILDQDGANLLDEETEGNILDQEIKITYEGEEYLLGEEVEETRAYMPIFSGLQLLTQDATGSKDCRMVFGQFEGAESYTLTATLDLGDGVEREVGFIREFKWKSNGEPEGSTTYTLDGEEDWNGEIIL